MAELFLDRIEGAVAVLEFEGREVKLPAKLLPPGAKEGEVLQLSLARDPEATRRAAAKVKGQRDALAGDDDGGDLKL